MNQEDPQACTKCGCMPEDILMLACSHDLCLNCASDRLAFEMRKNKNTNAIVCQECHEKTPLDGESISVLKSLIKPAGSNTRNYEQSLVSNSNKNGDTNNDSRLERAPRNQAEKYSYDKGNSFNDREAEYKNTTDRNNNKSKVSIPDVFQGISSKKNCTQHIDEEILYFCFDCRCQCICPECVIHGKHKDHDVKTIRKSQPLIKAQIDKLLQKIDANTQTLLIKRSQIDKQIRSLTQSNNSSKRQFQQVFDDLRSKISQTQKELLAKCDQNLADSLSQLQKSSKVILKKIDELKSYTSTMSQVSRKQDILFLNFYSRKYAELQQQSKQPQISIPQVQLSNNESAIASVLDISDQIARIAVGGVGGKVHR